MAAARLTAPGVMSIERAPVPRAAPGSVLVRTLHSSICGSDVRKVMGRLTPQLPGLPGYPGHESVAHVVESCSEGVAPGDLVLVVPEDKAAAGFAEYQLVPERYVIRAPAALDPLHLLMAQQLGTVIYALKRFLPCQAPATGAVFGLGPAGLQFVRLLKQAGVQALITADPSSFRAQRSRELGADLAVTAAATDQIAAAVHEFTRGHGCDLVIDAAGTAASRNACFRSVARHGRVGLYGLPEVHGQESWDYETLFHRSPTVELCVGAQREPGLASFREALSRTDDLAAGAALITHRLALDDINHAFSVAAAPTRHHVGKIVITWHDPISKGSIDES